MAPNETSALLKNYHNQKYSSDCNRNNGRDYHAVDDNSGNSHIVFVNKDPSEYEPIFRLNEYSSSLSLDELLPYKLDPWWENLRRSLLLIFWLLLLFTFLTACLLSYLHSGRASCNALEKAISAEMLTSPANSIFTTTTTFPIAIAKLMST